MHKIRRFLTRMQLRAREVSIIRGIGRQVNWYARKNFEDGVREGQGSEPDSPGPPGGK